MLIIIIQIEIELNQQRRKKPASDIKPDNGKRALVFWSLDYLVLDITKKYSIFGSMVNVTISKSENRAYISNYNMIPTINHKEEGKHYSVYKLTQHPEELFKKSKIVGGNVNISSIVEKCQNVMGSLADCY